MVANRLKRGIFRGELKLNGSLLCLIVGENIMVIHKRLASANKTKIK